MTMFFGIIMME